MQNPSESLFSIRFSSALKAARILSFHGKPKKVSQKPALWVQGYEEARAAAEKEHSSRIQAAETLLRAAAAELRNSLDAEIRAIELQVVDLALAIARSILLKEVEKGSYDLQGIVAGVLGKLRGEAGPYTVRLNPADHQVLTQAGSAGIWPEVKLSPDPAVPRASCAVDTAYGTIAREVDSLLAEIGQTLTRGKGGGGQ